MKPLALLLILFVALPVFHSIPTDQKYTLIGPGQKYWISCASHSMLPTLDCTDKLISIKTQDVNQGDLIWFYNPVVRGKQLPFILHRIIGEVNGKWRTKGDNNPVDDTGTFGLVSKNLVLLKVVGKYSG